MDLLVARLSAFAHPVRIRLVEHLSDGESSVGDLARAVHTTQQNVSKHLGVLHRAAIVARRRNGSFVLYRLADPDAIPLLEQAVLGIARRLRRRDG